ncbi:MAG: ferredoxin [Acidimicrobiales bacterium]|nr:ferredoxin [Acidimicrobiales bacterium]
MDLEIRVDRGTCIGSGQCVHWAPGVFDQDEGAISVVVDPRGEPAQTIVRAMTACPVHAITLHAGASTLRAGDFADWATGTDSNDPLVPLLMRFSEEHHEVLEALNMPVSDCAASVAAIGALVSEHLQVESRTYRELSGLIDRRVVDAFEAGHDQIRTMLDDVAVGSPDWAESERSLADLRALVVDHIRAEEAVLFPVVLSALADPSAWTGI